MELHPMTHRLLKPHVALIGLLAALAPLQSCSLLTNFDECVVADDCGAGEVCVGNVCEQEPGPPRIEIQGVISEDSVWTPDNIYVLKDVVTLIPGVTLTIEPGTRILGEQNSALLAREGAVLKAQGTRAKPIVFTSAKPVGQRLAGDWGGVALLGKAPVNRPNAFLNIIPGEAGEKFGGMDPEWDCGTVEYVRIEFAGGKIQGQNALNGLTLAGCGRKTKVSYVHTHFGGDDGVEIFGGTVNLSHIVITRSREDGLDIDLGWQGRMQFVAIQQDAAADNAIEIDNLKENPNATPLLDYKVYNYTLIGANRGGSQRGMQFKDGGLGFFSHGIIMGFSDIGVDIEGAESIARAQNGEIKVEHTLFYNIGQDGKSFFKRTPIPQTMMMGEEESMEPEELDVAAIFQAAASFNRFDKDPAIPSPFDLVKPGWSPGPTHTTNVPAPPAPFDPTAVYLGAFAPGSIPWTDAWTEFPGS
jgi:hypothetical protein